MYTHPFVISNIIFSEVSTMTKAKKVLAGLAAQQAEGKLCDIELIAEGQKIPAHKGVCNRR